MSFVAKLISLSIYPKPDSLVVYGILDQNGSIIKMRTKCSPDEIWELVSHTGHFRFYTKTDAIESRYKENTVPLFQIYSFDQITEEKVAIDSKMAFNVKFDDENTI